MRKKRLNITLPDELVVELKKTPGMSRFIAEALSEKIKRERRRESDAAIIEGYNATASEDRRLDEE
ncbi:MAG: type II toxin-antitoxin system CcdA family antitoxin [Candidatus Xenobiia bacterium LiM19]